LVHPGAQLRGGLAAVGGAVELLCEVGQHRLRQVIVIMVRNWRVCGEVPFTPSG
jgi:hypothetical protein